MFIGKGSLKDFLFIKVKHRHDGLSDQFNRIVMVKLFSVSALLMSVEFFGDHIDCLVPESKFLKEDFVRSTCWIQGVFIYENIPSQLSAYHGLPKSVKENGYKGNGYKGKTTKLCNVKDTKETGGKDSCKPLTKMYYTQYQYYSCYMASLAVLFYLPYYAFQMLNTDLIDLNEIIVKNDDIKIKSNEIINNYFDYKRNGGFWMLRLKILANLGVKLIYIVINISGFLFTNYTLYGKFKYYGLEWMKWTTQKDYHPRPGDVLLPTVVLCELAEASLSVNRETTDEHIFMCEITAHVLYQYVLLFIWFLFMLSVFISFAGFLGYLGASIFDAVFSFLPTNEKEYRFYEKVKTLTVREMEYLKKIKRNDLDLYNAVLMSTDKLNLSLKNRLF